MFNNTYITAQHAFEDMYRIINSLHTHQNGTRKLYNVGIKILDPFSNLILTEDRKWSKPYADREWEWYLSKNRSVTNLKKFAPMWDKMHNGNNIVNSNYGYLWNQSNQLGKVIEKLKQDPLTRQAFITIYDGKKMSEFEFDTPCTLSIGFVIDEGLLCMTVMMRSNDLWYGFCNDQYCFSNLQALVAKELKLDMGWYYHYATDMHIYRQHFNKL
jgi:thymidylate synthase